MSLNAYRSEQVVHWADDDAKSYPGWYLSHSGFGESVHPFDSHEQRESFAEAVKAALSAALQADAYMVETCAALVCVELLGDEYQRERGNEALDELCSEADAVREAAQAWVDLNL